VRSSIGWVSHAEKIVDVLERHFDEHRRLYTCGSGDPEAPYFTRFNAARLDEDEQTKGEPDHASRATR